MGFMDDDEKLEKINREARKTPLKTLYLEHAEKSQRIEELEFLKAVWKEEEKVLKDREAVIEWAENFNTVMQEKNLQVRQIKVENLVEIIEQNKELLFK